jgi:hypothetical protein
MLFYLFIYFYFIYLFLFYFVLLMSLLWALGDVTHPLYFTRTTSAPLFVLNTYYRYNNRNLSMYTRGQDLHTRLATVFNKSDCACIT